MHTRLLAKREGTIWLTPSTGHIIKIHENKVLPFPLMPGAWSAERSERI